MVAELNGTNGLIPSYIWSLDLSGQAPLHALVERLPLVYQGEAVGQLVLASRSGEAQLTRTDRRLLEDLARHAGVIAHAVRLIPIRILNGNIEMRKAG